MTPEQTRQIDLACLAEHTLKALGVNAEKPTAETVVDHAVGQACLELEAVESVLERHQLASNTELAQLVYIVAGIRERLELARECGETLATLLAEGTQHEIITRLSEATP
jgi:hypothetical protein